MSRLSPRIRELRIHLCQTGEASKGVRDFITKSYVALKKANPCVPILIRECSGVQPKLWARFDKGKESCVSLSKMSDTDVLNQVEKIGC